MGDNGVVTGNDCQLLTVRELAATLKLSERTCWRLAGKAEAGIEEFPRPLRVGPKAVRWRLADVEPYIARLAGHTRKKARK